MTWRSQRQGPRGRQKSCLLRAWWRLEEHYQRFGEIVEQGGVQAACTVDEKSVAGVAGSGQRLTGALMRRRNAVAAWGS